MKRTCPHCGNRSERLIQDNGEPPTSPDLTLLCVARVAPDAWSFETAPLPEDHDANGLVPCGMQWEANQ